MSTAMERPSWAPQEVDLDQPSAARVYDYILGGSHNFAIDRQMARQVLKIMPSAPQAAAANRAFLQRAVQYMSEQGITQFLDIGAGIPTVGSTHEVAQQMNPAAKVVYVDMEPVAVVHSRAILAGNENASVVAADLRATAGLIAAVEHDGLIDFSKPVGVLMIAVLHFLSPKDNPSEVVRQLCDVISDGSQLAITHGTTDGLKDELERIVALYANSPNPAYMRTREEIHALFAGHELVEPGVVFVPEWKPVLGELEVEEPEKTSVYGGLARKG